MVGAPVRSMICHTCERKDGSVRRGDDDFERAVDQTLAILREKVTNARDEADALLTYGELSTALGEYGLEVPYFGEPMPSVLESASEREVGEGRALISALVVEADSRRPGRGFFRLARRSPHRRTGDDDELWLTEVRRILAEGHGGGERMVNPANFGAWMIKCAPEVWDVAAYMADGNDTIDSWSVIPTYRADLMASGQPVLFWVTGRDNATPAPGLWGHGVVTGKVADQPPDRSRGYWINDGQRRRARKVVPVDIELMSAPIPRHVFRSDSRLAKLEVLRQPQMGNPLFVTKDEFQAITEYLAELDDVKVTITGAGFGGVETRAAVEQAAVEAVTRQYTDKGWAVADVSDKNLGWDLTCTSPEGDIEEVEVKGVSGVLPIIFLTRNEARAAARSTWRLAVVTRARSMPTITIVDGATAMAAASAFMYKVRLSVNP